MSLMCNVHVLSSMYQLLEVTNAMSNISDNNFCSLHKPFLGDSFPTNLQSAHKILQAQNDARNPLTL